MSRITDSVTYVGKVDWELTKFHGEEYSTYKGSSYNSYLIRDKKIALVDTVWKPYGQEFISKLEKVVDLDEIDFVIANHAEIDHSGALPALMERIPDKPVYCTANCVKSLTGQYHKDWNFQVVKTGDTLSLGAKELTFVSAPMLHWPDSMFCYLSGDNILFSNDAFGHHLASEQLFNDQVDQGELYEQCIKYYANILTPFSKLVQTKINEIIALKLPVDMICPSHGVIWRENPLQIVHKYLEWSGDYQEDQATIIYDTMWESTRLMAEAMAEGILSARPEMTVKLLNTARRDKNEIITEVFKSKLLLAGSPTINKGILHSMAGMLEMIKGMSFKNKMAAAFGSFGWSGESVKIISQWLSESGFSLLDEGLRVNWKPDQQGRQQCFEYGRSLANQL
ncbi:MAG: anaerobic nitric oxide reductase flavorubredoxin [Deltaproteobacteria bacterium]|nr:anaerobic nitric oxide reductase flavorubredoxin [Deltaproteobacteria bacterium]